MGMEHIILWASLAFAVAVLVLLAREDWGHLLRTARRATARVTGHRESTDGDGRSYAALLEFVDEGGETIIVEDKVYSGAPRPVVGSLVEITYPGGAPLRARIKRPVLRFAIYAALFCMIAVLVGRLAGWLSAGSGEVAGL